jgi:hypothetical protein
MPATATGRGAQVVLDPLSDTVKAARGAYATTFVGNAAKVAADVLAGIVADGSRSDGTTTTGGVAADVDVNPSAAAEVTGSIAFGTTAGPTITSGTGVASGTQPSGSIFIRTDGAAGARIYVSQGAGSWIAIATV